MATAFKSSGFAAEMEAETVKEILQSNGVQAMGSGIDVLPGAHEILAEYRQSNTKWRKRPRERPKNRADVRLLLP
jgi:hypothetical protein